MGEYIIVDTVNSMAAGRFVALVKGSRIRLTDTEADDLLRAGYIEAADVETNAAAAIETAALAPSETATAPAQKSVKRKA